MNGETELWLGGLAILALGAATTWVGLSARRGGVARLRSQPAGVRARFALAIVVGPMLVLLGLPLAVLTAVGTLPDGVLGMLLVGSLLLAMVLFVVAALWSIAMAILRERALPRTLRRARPHARRATAPAAWPEREGSRG